MRVSRVYYPIEIKPQQGFEVDGSIHHYLSRVLRLNKGDAVRFFNNKGCEFLCTLTDKSRQTSAFMCEREIEVLPEVTPKVKLYLAVCKSDSMDFSVQKATELGVREIQPLISEHSLTKNIADKRRLHWQGVAESACEQCGRVIVPQIADPIALQEITKIEGDDKAIICCLNTQISIKEQADKILTDLLERKAMLHLMIGPEGDFSSDEIAHAISLDFEPAGLGDYVLRSDTAVVAALSVIRFLQ